MANVLAMNIWLFYTESRDTLPMDTLSLKRPFGRIEMSRTSRGIYDALKKE